MCHVCAKCGGPSPATSTDSFAWLPKFRYSVFSPNYQLPLCPGDIILCGVIGVSLLIISHAFRSLRCVYRASKACKGTGPPRPCHHSESAFICQFAYCVTGLARLAGRPGCSNVAYPGFSSIGQDLQLKGAKSGGRKGAVVGSEVMSLVDTVRCGVLGGGQPC